MRKRIDHIEIKDPPLEELSKKHSCLKRTCFSCLGFLFILVAASLLILKFTLGPDTHTLKTLPRNFARTVPIYDSESIETISVTSGDKRSRGVEAFAFVPKLIAAPFLLFFDQENQFIREYRPELSEAISREDSTWGKFLLFMSTPVGDHRDIIRIEWRGLTADREFIAEYYDTELEKKKFTVGNRSESTTVSQFAFQKDDIDGVVYIEDAPSTSVTDYVSLTVTLDLEE